jgi:hypothetical protein
MRERCPDGIHTSRWSHRGGLATVHFETIEGTFVCGEARRRLSRSALATASEVFRTWCWALVQGCGVAGWLHRRAGASSSLRREVVPFTQLRCWLEEKGTATRQGRNGLYGPTGRDGGTSCLRPAPYEVYVSCSSVPGAPAVRETRGQAVCTGGKLPIRKDCMQLRLRDRTSRMRSGRCPFDSGRGSSAELALRHHMAWQPFQWESEVRRRSPESRRVKPVREQ